MLGDPVGDLGERRHGTHPRTLTGRRARRLRRRGGRSAGAGRSRPSRRRRAPRSGPTTAHERLAAHARATEHVDALEEPDGPDEDQQGAEARSAVQRFTAPRYPVLDTARASRNTRDMSAEEIDAYLAGVEEPKRSTLEALRRSILAVVPDAEQCISYGMPAFRVDGVVVAGFAAFKNHLAYLPHSGAVLGDLGDDLAAYERTAGSLHFADRRAAARRPGTPPGGGEAGPRRPLTLPTTAERRVSRLNGRRAGPASGPTLRRGCGCGQSSACASLAAALMSSASTLSIADSTMRSARLECLADLDRARVGDQRQQAGVARLDRVGQRLGQLALVVELAELADRGATGAQDGRAAEDRRREDHAERDAADDAPLEAGLGAVVGGLLDLELAVGRPLDHDHALDLDGPAVLDLLRAPRRPPTRCRCR